MDKIKVAIADDHKLFREGVRACLQSSQSMQVMMEAENGQDLIDKLATSRVLPEVILLDLRMPLKDGFETTSLISKKYPRINIIVLTMHDEIQFVRRVYELGAKAYLLKNAEPVEIRNAIVEVMKKAHVHDDSVKKITGQLPGNFITTALRTIRIRIFESALLRYAAASLL